MQSGIDTRSLQVASNNLPIGKVTSSAHCVCDISMPI
ncbi:unnamed protein product [Chironomus riparius]|uniref:Uncharacterized protein n=1 Tax=Chironomus riparius TaxID=315576 RepID=A0A9N9WU81_9DIPT|nr:unnamed protein product [Chironomus riparius]